jgi:hypothetical protein
LVVFNNLCSVFSRESRDINIDHLPCFITVHLMPPSRRSTFSSFTASESSTWCKVVPIRPF